MLGAFTPGLLMEHMGWSGLNLSVLALSLCFLLLLAIVSVLLNVREKIEAH